VLIREGLKGLSSPLLGLSVGMVVSVAAFGLLLAVRRSLWAAGSGDEPPLWNALSYKLTAGIFVALSTWGRWVAVDLTTIGIVLALGLMSVPVVLLLSPVLMGRHVEVVNAQVWTGALLVVGGSLLLIVRSL
jgi:uncharacterized membrane protein